MTQIEAALKQGFSKLRSCGGRKVRTSTGETVLACIEDIAALVDPVDLAQAKIPIYTRVYVMAGEITSPRSVTTFTEVGSERWHKVLKYEESSQANWRQCWLCEAQRA